MEYQAKQSVNIEEGKHKGVILRHNPNKEAEKNGEKFYLHEIEITVDGIDYPLSVGYGVTVSEDSKLGQLLKRFGATIVPGQGYDPEEYLPSGIDVQFLVKHVDKDGKTFSVIDKDTVRPVDGTQKSL